MIANKSGLGTAGIVVINKDQDIVECMARIARFYKHESCGQCTPCREGSGWMWRILDRVVKRKATYSDVDLLSDVTRQIEGHTICAFGEGSAWPVQGLLRHFRKEVESRCREEPLIRKNLIHIIEQTRELYPDIELCLTTNAIFLHNYIDELIQNGSFREFFVKPQIY